MSSWIEIRHRSLVGRAVLLEKAYSEDIRIIDAAGVILLRVHERFTPASVRPKKGVGLARFTVAANRSGNRDANNSGTEFACASPNLDFIAGGSAVAVFFKGAVPDRATNELDSQLVSRSVSQSGS